jgi:hypothetical protein
MNGVFILCNDILQYIGMRTVLLERNVIIMHNILVCMYDVCEWAPGIVTCKNHIFSITN